MQKTCKVCGETKDVVKGSWPLLHGAPYRDTCCKCLAAKHRAMRADPVLGPTINKTTRRANAALRATPEGKAAHNEASREWQYQNAGRCAAKSKMYRATKLHRTPKWLTAADRKAMEDKYVVAQFFSYVSMIPHHVDHIVPLQGQYVSGLHVPSNLCVRLGVENLSKGNRWPT